MKSKLKLVKNKNIFLIGLTGGFGTGKTTAALEFAKLGAKVIGADKVGKDITKPGMKAYKAVLNVFGKDILLPNKNIDRKALAGIVFENARKRKQLENIMHSAIIDEINKETASLAKKGKFKVILEVPLLFETGLNRFTDFNIVVWASKKSQLERLLKRGKFKTNEVELRIKAQMPLELKKKKADCLIDNSKTISDVKNAIKRIWENI
jgi:dephospho-CoA kinase